MVVEVETGPLHLDRPFIMPAEDLPFHPPNIYQKVTSTITVGTIPTPSLYIEYNRKEPGSAMQCDLQMQEKQENKGNEEAIDTNNACRGKKDPGNPNSPQRKHETSGEISEVMGQPKGSRKQWVLQNLICSSTIFYIRGTVINPQPQLNTSIISDICF